MSAPDLSGHGPLATGAATSMASECEQLAALWGERGCPPVLLGYSMGGRTALSWALAAPESFSALVLISASPGIADAAERTARREADAKTAALLLEAGASAFALGWEENPIIRSQRAIPAPYGEELRQRRRKNLAAGLAASLKGMGTGAQPSLWDRLGGLALPTLIVSGSEDPKFEDIADRMTTFLPSSRRLSVADAGHCAHLEQPELTAAGVRRFLEELGLCDSLGGVEGPGDVG
jgi:2-succinyl-6-hydroxy-2,4-cyclohexadiene-1-carboxylate synthase